MGVEPRGRVIQRSDPNNSQEEDSRERSKAIHKRLSAHWSRAEKWLRGIAARQPQLFAHWQLGVKCAKG